MVELPLFDRIEVLLAAEIHPLALEDSLWPTCFRSLLADSVVDELSRFYRVESGVSSAILRSQAIGANIL